MMNLKWKKLSPEAIIPQYQTNGSSGFDFHACPDDAWQSDIEGKLFIAIPSMSQKIIGTGLAMVIPDGFEVQVRPRSGLAAKHCITITNSPGTIDASYRNEVKCIMFNMGQEPFIIRAGDRIAQGVLQKVEQAKMEEIVDFSAEDMAKDRGGGFGSTGTSATTAK